MHVVTKIARFLSDKWKCGSRRALNGEFYQICENRVVFFSQKWFYLAGKWNYYDGIKLDAPTILDSSRHSVSWNEARKKRLNGLV